MDAALADAAHALLVVFALTEPAASATDANGQSLAAPFPTRDDLADDARPAPPQD